MAIIYGRIGTPQWYTADFPEPTVPAGWAIMQSPPPMDNPSNFAYYEYRARPDGTWQYTQIPAPPKTIVWYDGKLQVDNGDYTFSPVSPSILPAKRRFRLDVTLGANGSTTVDLSQYNFLLPPSLYQITTENAAGQSIYPKFASQTPTSVVVTGRRTRAAVLLNNGPYEAAPAGEVVSFWVHEN